MVTSPKETTATVKVSLQKRMKKQKQKNRRSFCIFGIYFSLSNTFFFYVFFLFQDHRDIECPQVPPASYGLTQTFQSPN